MTNFLRTQDANAKGFSLLQAREMNISETVHILINYELTCADYNAISVKRCISLSFLESKKKGGYMISSQPSRT